LPSPNDPEKPTTKDDDDDEDEKDSEMRLFCQVSDGLERLFDAGGPWDAATEAHTVTEIFSVGGKDASGSDGNPMLVERSGGERRGVGFFVKLNP
jgi:hypothetical protein